MGVIKLQDNSANYCLVPDSSIGYVFQILRTPGVFHLTVQGALWQPVIFEKFNQKNIANI